MATHPFAGVSRADRAAWSAVTLSAVGDCSTGPALVAVTDARSSAGAAFSFVAVVLHCRTILVLSAIALGNGRAGAVSFAALAFAQGAARTAICVMMVMSMVPLAESPARSAGPFIRFGLILVPVAVMMVAMLAAVVLQEMDQRGKLLAVNSIVDQCANDLSDAVV